MAIKPGTDIGRYHILEQLGEGGMALVYKAYDTRLESYVAIKVIRSEKFTIENTARALKRFQIEAKKMAQLNHPNIVKVMDYGEFEGAPYLVMPYLPGGTLKQKLGLQLSWEEAISLLIPIVEALEYAHCEGLIHRDIKPSNILITKSGKPMLSDFGVAKVLESKETLDLTTTGMGIGTPEYMSPEQAEGSKVDERSDIYSLGIILYELLTGRKPFVADTPMAVMVKQIQDPLPQPSQFMKDLPVEIEQVLFKMLTKEPAERYQDMDEVKVKLEKLFASKEQLKKHIAPVSTVLESSLINNSTLKEFPSVPVDSSAIPSKGKEYGANKIFNSMTKAIWIAIGASAVVIISLAVYSYIQNNRVTNILKPKPSLVPKENIISSPKTSFTKFSPNDGTLMVYVPAGEFSMGYENGEGDESPVHSVFLDSYYIDQTEVSNTKYAHCVAANACTEPRSFTDSHYGDTQYDNFPVINVDWYQANSYCIWVERYLPSEAQWEKAARGTDGCIYPWGNDEPDSELVNFNKYKGDATPVNSYFQGVSPYGVLNMAGNVREWVADWYDASYYSTQEIWANPTGPGETGDHVLRGGSWYENANGIRAMDRYWGARTRWSRFIGFRCAMDAE